MTATDDDTQKVPTGRDAVDRLRSQGALDGLFEQIDVGQVKMTGADGLLPALVKEALERGLAAELTEHLGYEKGEPTSQARSNARNGTTPKTVDSEVGPFEIEVPRDRAGTFTPRLVRKGQRRLDELDAMIISLYAGGMTVRDIQHHLASTLSVELSAGTISKITDAVADAVLEWQRRPLDEFYPVIYHGRDPGQGPRQSPGRLPLGPYRGRRRHGRDQARGLRIWVQAEEGASFWAHVCAELANRGVSDVLIVCCDGLTGLPEAIEATWPQATVQTCVVHLIRASMRFVSYGDRKKVAAAVKPIYTAPSQEAAWQALTDFSESDLGVKYPQTVTTWERAWERFTPFLDFPPMLRRVIYTTNSIESLNYQLRKVTKNRGHFPSDEAVVKLPKAGDLRHRGQTSPRTRQGERTASIQAQGQGQTRRRTDHHRLEQGPGPAHHRLPRPIRPPPVNRLHRNLDRLAGDRLYRARRTLLTGAGLLTDAQAERLEALFADDRHAAVQAAWGVYQRLIQAYRTEDPGLGKYLMQRLIDSLKQAIPDGLEEIQALARTLTSRSQDILAYFDQPRTSNGPTEAINGRLEHLRGIALGFRNLANYTIRSLIHTGRLKDHLTTTT